MKSVSSLLLALALSGLRIGIGPASAADVSAGKATAESCAGCHGADGISQMPLTPSLAGQSDEFVQWQLVYFRAGTRKSEVMGPIAEALTNEEIRNLGAYYASLPPPKPQACRRHAGADRRKARFAAPLRVVSRRRLLGFPGGGAACRPARGRFAQGAARFQIRSPRGVRRRLHVRCRLRAQRRRHAGAGALHGDATVTSDTASVTVQKSASFLPRTHHADF